ncbi:MAG: hypothetical protein ACJAW1_000503, partial [Glaciecola sp.]
MSKSVSATTTKKVVSSGSVASWRDYYELTKP